MVTVRPLGMLVAAEVAAEVEVTVVTAAVTAVDVVRTVGAVVVMTRLPMPQQML